MNCLRMMSKSLYSLSKTEVIPDHAVVFLSDKTHFVLTKKHAPSPCALHEKHMLSNKVMIWSVISADSIIGPYFCEEDNGATVTITSDRYVNMLRTPNLNDPEDLQDTEIWL